MSCHEHATKTPTGIEPRLYAVAAWRLVHERAWEVDTERKFTHSFIHGIDDFLWELNDFFFFFPFLWRVEYYWKDCSQLKKTYDQAVFFLFCW